ncbi:6-phosphogluconolactonase [Vallitalea okinawensis]|uniref:6-phosphogluconolactonase n=1 Tax=Vallitalea okinawensis TaxID=2078660 RepID=UPI001A9A58D8|nr:6-phosphogluconolactonase [Vallitalea okinawensis]
MTQFKVDKLNVEVYNNRLQMGTKVAEDLILTLNQVIEMKGEARVIFAAAVSQLDVLKVLKETDKVDWSKVVAFHMDEYHTLPITAQQRFGNFLNKHIFNALSFKEVNLLCDDERIPLEQQITNYEIKIKEKEIDVVICGIGENGHLAFNDPPVADFNDKAVLKVVELDHVCKMQQVHDGAFNEIEEVPSHALTLTIPFLMNVGKVFCVVPGAQKASAVYRTLNDSIDESCPSTILRRFDNSTLYLDKSSFGGGK